MHAAGGRTSFVVGLVFWEKLVGLRRSLVEVRAHTAIAIKKYSFYFLKIGFLWQERAPYQQRRA